jgi:predicted AlkP superfamily phosphohydrolase/phosphomutase
MVALDGLEIAVLRRAMDSGRLPNLRAFCETSRQLSVISDGERLEGTVWPTFASGTGPGTHGHHWFYQWVAEENRFVTGSDPRFDIEPFWKAALDAGKRVLALDVPYLRPLNHPNERIYNGWGLQDEMAEHFYPPSFRKEILKRHGRSKVHKDTLLTHTPEDRLKLARGLRAGARQRSRVLVDFAARRDWDLCIFGYGEYHLGGHHLSEPMALSPKVNNEQAMVSILRPVDDAWPDVVRAAGDDCDIVLFAVHGMQHKSSYAEAAQHMIELMAGREPAPPPPPDLLRKLRNLLPQSVHQAIWLRMSAEFRMKRMIEAWSARMNFETDTLLVFEGDCAVAIRVNLLGREVTGKVAPGDARRAVTELFEYSRRFRTEEGEIPFVDVDFMEDLFSGKRLQLLPDATLKYNPKVARTRRLTRDDGYAFDLTGPESRNGIHTGHGFAFYRPGGELSVARDDFPNEDFAPTILQRLGVEPPGHLEGTPFAE